MVYPDEWIVEQYRHALDPVGQIEILAQLNSTTKEKIKFLLLENGCMLPEANKGYRRRGHEKVGGARVWTKEEEKLILQLRKEKVTYEKIGILLNRSKSAVERRYYKIQQREREKKYAD